MQSTKVKLWWLWVLVVAALPAVGQTPSRNGRVLYYSPIECHDPFLNSGFLEHVRRETRKDTLLVQFATDNCPLIFTLFAAPDGTIEDVLLETRVDASVDDRLRDILLHAPPLAEQRYHQREVPAIYPLSLDWRKVLNWPAGVLPEGNELQLPRTLVVPSFPGGERRLRLVLKPLHTRLRRALATGQPLLLDLAFSSKGSLKEIRPLNLPDAPLAAETTKRLWAAYRQSRTKPTPLRSGRRTYASRVLLPLTLPEEPNITPPAKRPSRYTRSKGRLAQRVKR
ncbi:hypothetical protein [Hymenobacter weizhouensis]|uniref:hypothetical protein n=1 Tax=Hymenobacter sp. YIM 151500-1 TaxID=2987689 RepID=UPI002227AEB0|nr:hypothetical protein [Hymenobacter sp. YIM 151500-1]UYZ64632.1 hypothetical protein OIS53_07220 [Hymenobacter sp. YIM 151500-1]